MTTTLKLREFGQGIPFAKVTFRGEGRTDRAIDRMLRDYPEHTILDRATIPGASFVWFRTKDGRSIELSTRQHR